METFIRLFKLFFNSDSKEEDLFFPGIIREPYGGVASKENVYDFDEVVGASDTPVFEEKSPDKWKKYLSQDQGKTSSCVPHTTAKIAQILYFLTTGHLIKFSPVYWYKDRYNKPEEGMAFGDIASLASKGALLEIVMPSQGLTESQMNNAQEMPFHDALANPLALPKDWVELPINFDIIAATVKKTNKGVMAWFTFGKNEFFSRSIPVDLGVDRVFAHSITIVDAVKYQGVDYLVAEDSAEISNPSLKFGHQRLISRSFFNKCFLARYPITFRFQEIMKPKYDGSIISVQKCLQYEKLLATNITLAENLGPLTRTALIKFQGKYHLLQSGSLTTETVEKLKQLYS